MGESKILEPFLSFACLFRTRLLYVGSTGGDMQIMLDFFGNKNFKDDENALVMPETDKQFL